jgi:hypothetical protein
MPLHSRESLSREVRNLDLLHTEGVPRRGCFSMVDCARNFGYKV